MNIEKKIKKANGYFQAKEFSKAEAILKEVIKLDNNNVGALASLSQISFIQNDLISAEYYLEKVSNIKEIPELLNNLLSIKFKLNKIKDALTIINILIKQYPKDISLNLAKAQITRDLGNDDEAINILEKLSFENNQNINVLISLGFTLNKIKKYDEAISVYKKALKIDPNNFATIYNCGLTYLNKKKYAESIELLELALKIDKQNINLNLTLVAAYEFIKDFNKAKKIIKKLKNMYPNSSKVYFQSAALYLHQERLDDALIEINKAIDLDDNNHEAKYSKANILLKKKKYKEGMDLYRWRVKKDNLFTKFNDIHINEIHKNEKLLIYFEQGLGDQILYSRFVDELSRHVEECVLVVQEKIVDLLSSSLKKTKVISEKNYKDSDFLEYKKLNLGSCGRFIDNLEHLITNPILIKVNELEKKEIESRYKDKKLIGISWKSNNKDLGEFKSLKLKEIINKIKFPKNYEIINLQYGDIKNEINSSPVKIINDEKINLFDDISGLAALINQCEYIITVSNITAHISGILGKKTYLLAPHGMGLFWYWSKDVNVYPNMHILRQLVNGTWDNAFELINEQIKI